VLCTNGGVSYVFLNHNFQASTCMYFFIFLRTGRVQSSDSCLLDSWGFFLGSEVATAFS